MTELPEEAVEALQRFFFEHDIDIELAPAALTSALPHLPAYTVERELREALEKAATALDIPDHKWTDTVFLRGASLCAKAFVSAAIAALSRAPAPERTVGEKVLDTGISNETKEQLAGIDANIRDAARQMKDVLVGRTVAPAEPVAVDEIKTESMGEFLLAAFLTYLADGNTIRSSAALALDKHEQAYEPADPLASAPMQEDAGR